jgi:glutathione peroxidase
MMKTEKSFFDFSARTLMGGEMSFDSFKGQVLLVVNVASKCGFTYQYAGLEALQKKYADRGFNVLGFPCNQFGAQEPGDENEIKNFCSLKYDVTFPLFAKISVNGPQTHPVYEFMKMERAGLLGTTAIKWNFTKFLINKQGQVIRRYGPQVTPQQLESDILLALDNKI